MAGTEPQLRSTATFRVGGRTVKLVPWADIAAPTKVGDYLWVDGVRYQLVGLDTCSIRSANAGLILREDPA